MFDIRTASATTSATWDAKPRWYTLDCREREHTPETIFEYFSSLRSRHAGRRLRWAWTNRRQGFSGSASYATTFPFFVRGRGRSAPKFRSDLDGKKLAQGIRSC